MKKDIDDSVFRRTGFQNKIKTTLGTQTAYPCYREFCTQQKLVHLKDTMGEKLDKRELQWDRFSWKGFHRSELHT